MRTNKTVIYHSKLRFMTILLFGLFILTFCSGNMRSGLSYETHKLKDFTYYTDIRQWKAITPPKDEALMVAGSSKYEWKVYLDNGVPRAIPRGPWKRKQSKNVPTFDTKTGGFFLIFNGYCFLKVSDGWLVGYNYGEWGGGLAWFSKDGKKHYKIKNRLIKHHKIGNRDIYLEHIYSPIDKFEKVNGKIFALDGGLDYTVIYHLFKKKGEWTGQEVLDLETSFQTMFKGKNELFIVSYDRLIRVSLKTLRETLIYKGLDLADLPNSIIRLKNVFYIGIRQGVVKITVTKGKTSMEYLIPHPRVLKDDMKQ